MNYSRERSDFCDSSRPRWTYARDDETRSPSHRVHTSGAVTTTTTTAKRIPLPCRAQHGALDIAFGIGNIRGVLNRGDGARYNRGQGRAKRRLCQKSGSRTIFPDETMSTLFDFKIPSKSYSILSSHFI